MRPDRAERRVQAPGRGLGALRRRGVFPAVPALFLGLGVAACNAILGNVQPTLDDSLSLIDAAPGPDAPSLPDRDDHLGDVVVIPEAGADASGDADAGPRQPDPSCVATSGQVSNNAVKKVEMDTTPTPTRTATTVTAAFSIYGDNALSNVRLDFCTADGLKSNVGGGINFLGGGGAVTRHWQTKNPATLPLGLAQAQVWSDDPPVLRYITTLDLR